MEIDWEQELRSWDSGNKETKNKNPKMKQEGNKMGIRTPKLDKKQQSRKKNTKMGQEPEEIGNKKEQEPQSKTRMGQSRQKWEQ